MSTEPIILRSTSGADFLAALPSLVGFTVSESLLVVPFVGTRTMAVMRTDLPDTPGAVEQLASVAVGSMSRLDDCDGVAFAAYTDDTFPVAFAARESMVRCLDDAFDAAGFAVRDAFCVAGDGWASWYEPSPPPAGHPLTQIARSPLAAQAAAARGGGELPAHTSANTLPSPDPAFAEQLNAAVRALRSGRGRGAFGDRRAAAPFDDAVGFVERLLAHDAADVAVAMLARLTVLSGLPARRDEMTLQIAFGRKVGARARADSDRRHAAQRATGMSMDELIAAEAASHPAHADPMGELIVGESTRQPRIARIRRGIDILRHAICHLETELRPDLLCMLAWLHWASGASTAAAHHIASARAIDPAHGMSRNLDLLVSSGRIPEWIFAHHNAAAPRRARRARRRPTAV